MTGTFARIRASAKASSLAQRFLGGAAWSVIGAVGSSGITLIVWMIVARLLGKETYGQFILIQSTLSTVGVFAGFGIGLAATRYVAELKRGDLAKLGRILILGERSIFGFGVLASGGLVVAAHWLASQVLNSSTLGPYLLIASPIVLLSALDSYQKSVLIGLESMRAFATGSIIAICASAPILIIVVDRYGFRGAVIGLVVMSLIQVSVSRYQMTRELSKLGVIRDSSGWIGERNILWQFALPALVSGALVGPVHWVAQAMLANAENGYAELAVLGITMQWFNVILFVPGSAGRVVLPMLTSYVAEGDWTRSRMILIVAVAVNMLIAVPMAGVVMVLSPYIMKLYGQDFEANYGVLVVGALTAVLAAVQSPIGTLIAAKSRMWLGASMNLGWACTYLTLSYFLVNKGAFGVLLALFLGYVAHFVWTSGFAIRETRAECAQVSR